MCLAPRSPASRVSTYTASGNAMTTVYNIGSINIDHRYALEHFPAPGETLAASAYTRSLGGKGCNQSVALARAGAHVAHVGAIGPGDEWIEDTLRAEGIDTRHVARISTETGHAIVMVERSGENSILIHPGANRALSAEQVESALRSASPGDWALCQCETNRVGETLSLARELGLRTAFNPAPFSAAVVADLPGLDLLVVNALEADSLAGALGCAVEAIPVAMLVVTRGGDGCSTYCDGQRLDVPAFPVVATDTTCAGDTFIGYALAGLAAGADLAATLRLASAAAAICVTRPGAVDAIPARAEAVRLAAGASGT